MYYYSGVVVKGFYVTCPYMFPTRDYHYRAGPPKRPDEGIHSAEPLLFSTQWGSKAHAGRYGNELANKLAKEAARNSDTC